MIASRRVVLLVAATLAPWPAAATVEMQTQAKKLGVEVHNCLYCHASPHSIEKMKAKARATGMSDGNCLACHGANIPAALNHRGDWLVAEKGRRNARDCDMAWLKDYKEPMAPKAPVAEVRRQARPEAGDHPAGPEALAARPSGHAHLDPPAPPGRRPLPCSRHGRAPHTDRNRPRAPRAC